MIQEQAGVTAAGKRAWLGLAVAPQGTLANFDLGGRYTPAVEGGGSFDGWPLSIHSRAGVELLLAEADAAEWTGPDASSRLESSEWILPRAVWHDAVVRAAAGLGERDGATSTEGADAAAAVLPLPFGTLFGSAQAIDRSLEAKRAVLHEAFDRVRGREEWGVKLCLDLDGLVKQEVDSRLATLSEEGELSPGKRFFVERRLQREVAAEVGALKNERIAAFGDWLEARVPVLRQLERSRSDAGVAAKFAALIDRDDASSFAASVSASWSQATVTLTGPWPAYNFVPRVESGEIEK